MFTNSQELQQKTINLDQKKKQISEDLKNIKISIVMAYFNRKTQTIETLNTFQKLYQGIYNFEVIIVDDNSNEENKLEQEIKQFDFPIKLIVIDSKEKGNRINPCGAYNKAFTKATGDIIIIQNPEIYHCGNIIEYILLNINLVKNNYITFPVFSSPSFKHNNKLYKIQYNFYKKFIQAIDYRDYDFNYKYYIQKYPEFKNMNATQAENHYLQYGIKQGKVCNKENIFYRKNIIYQWKGWYNHYKYRPCNFHFLSVITRQNLNKVGGFCDDFKSGLWYDDDDFLYRIKKTTKVLTLNSEKYFGIHQYHVNGTNDQMDSRNFKTLVSINRNIFKRNIANNIIYCNPLK